MKYKLKKDHIFTTKEGNLVKYLSADNRLLIVEGGVAKMDGVEVVLTEKAIRENTDIFEQLFTYSVTGHKLKGNVLSITFNEVADLDIDKLIAYITHNLNRL